ncbi:MAG: GHMP kinase [Methanoregulaceae archaeon]|nr:GHMP kinase [Methanoregulaceae archaeon]
MPSSVTAFCPGHLSGYFSPVIGRDPASTGSIGAGMVICEGVTAHVTRAGAREIVVRRADEQGNILCEVSRSPPLSYLMERLSVTVRIETVCRLPIGAGFGLSAASLVASALAINALFNLGLSQEDCCAIAHEAEIVHHSGLGDVAACQGGGRDFREGAGIFAPITRYFDLREPLFALHFGPLPSSHVLSSPEALRRVAGAYPGGIPDSPRRFFELSRTFAKNCGLLTPEVIEILAHCEQEEVPASMTMLGNGVFSLGLRGREIFSAYGEVYELRMAESGPRITGIVP